jgi:hypothetical protein
MLRLFIGCFNGFLRIFLPNSELVFKLILGLVLRKEILNINLTSEFIAPIIRWYLLPWESRRVRKLVRPPGLRLILGFPGQPPSSLNRPTKNHHNF